MAEPVTDVGHACQIEAEPVGPTPLSPVAACFDPSGLLSTPCVTEKMVEVVILKSTREFVTVWSLAGGLLNRRDRRD